MIDSMFFHQLVRLTHHTLYTVHTEPVLCGLCAQTHDIDASSILWWHFVMLSHITFGLFYFIFFGSRVLHYIASQTIACWVISFRRRSHTTIRHSKWNKNDLRPFPTDYHSTYLFLKSKSKWNNSLSLNERDSLYAFRVSKTPRARAHTHRERVKQNRGAHTQCCSISSCLRSSECTHLLFSVINTHSIFVFIHGWQN